MMKRLLTAAALTLAVSVWLLSASVYLLGTNDALMLGLMERSAPSASTGLPAAEYPAMVQMITRYLRGKTDDFQHHYTRNGMELLAFNPKEQQHMQDVQELFHLCRCVLLFGGMAIIAFLGLNRAHLRRNLWCGLRKGLLCVLGAAVILALFAAIDFDSLFILFHHIAFTNDLWLLDPRTDLLIRLMPTAFFVAYAALIGALWATLMGLLILLFTFVSKEKKA